MKVFKRILLIIAIVLGAILLAVAGLFTYLTITEYRPADQEQLEILDNSEKALDKTEFTVLTWNVGYCALGEKSDFFMDGGKTVRPDSKDVIIENLAGVRGFLSGVKADFTLLQEVDSDSKRSYGVDEVTALREKMGQTSAYAMNFCTNYVPYPWPTLGRVHSGLLSFSCYEITEAERISLPCPFSWPVSMVNLKRCLLVSRIPVAGSDKELVLVNLHLEAYDDGEGKLAQSQQLRDFLSAEYEKGNYVVAGGDWNQIFPRSEKSWANTHMELWTPGYLDEAELSSGWRYVWDDTVPTCRLLNQPYDPADTENTQYYVIDGFLVSPNLTVTAVETLDESFAFSDHNPVLMTLKMEN